jgi:hypothetical protein
MPFTKRSSSGAEIAVAIVVFALLAGFISLLGALLLQWAWGFVAVPVFGAPPLTYWQAFAALVLLNIIGGGIRQTRRE